MRSERKLWRSDRESWKGILKPATSVLILLVFLAPTKAQAPVQITGSTVLDASLKPGVSHEYALRLAIGESAEVVVRQQGIDVIVDLTSPAGKLLDSVDSPTGNTGDEVVEIIAKENGTYGIRVRPFDSNEPPGKYRLEVRALRSVVQTTQLLQARRAARSAATEWLRPRSHAIPSSGVLAKGVRVPPLDQIAERVKVLGLGEATHGSREFNDLRFSLTRYLIERHGFRIIAIEASVDTIRLMASYINGESNLTPPLTRLIESGWIGRRSRKELFEWARAWNRSHPRDRVLIVGVDPQENASSRQVLRAFLEHANDPELMKRWVPAEADLAAADEQTAVFADSGIAAATRQLLVEIVAMFELDAPLLTTRFGAATVGAAREAATTLAEFADFNSNSPGAISHSRDWYMAGRIMRALQSKGPSAKAVYWAHNAHVTHPANSTRTAGALLRRAIGCDYAALALTFGEGDFIAQLPNDLEDRLVKSSLPMAPDESIESVLTALHPEGALTTWPCFASPAQSEIGSVPEWLRTAHLMHWVGGIYTPGSAAATTFRSFDLLKDFEGIAFLRRVTAEEIPTDRPIIPARKR